MTVPVPDLGKRKRELRRERDLREHPIREQRRRERRCFWTWPFGHVRVPPDWCCGVCGAKPDMGDF